MHIMSIGLHAGAGALNMRTAWQHSAESHQRRRMAECPYRSVRRGDSQSITPSALRSALRRGVLRISPSASPRHIAEAISAFRRERCVRPCLARWPFPAIKEEDPGVARQLERIILPTFRSHDMLIECAVHQLAECQHTIQRSCHLAEAFILL